MELCTVTAMSRILSQPMLKGQISVLVVQKMGETKGGTHWLGYGNNREIAFFTFRYVKEGNI